MILTMNGDYFGHFTNFLPRSVENLLISMRYQPHSSNKLVQYLYLLSIYYFN
jgi:hypothetical protein